MAPKFPLITNDFKLSTWLIFGALIESLFMITLPQSFAIRLPALLLILRGFLSYLEATGSASAAICIGRWKARISDQGPYQIGNDGVVIFILGARTLQYVIVLSFMKRDF
jgi:hypothetical protein